MCYSAGHILRHYDIIPDTDSFLKVPEESFGIQKQSTVEALTQKSPFPMGSGVVGPDVKYKPSTDVR